MVLVGIVVFGIGFIIALVGCVVGYTESYSYDWDGDRRHAAIVGVLGMLAFLAVGSSLSYWFWNAGLEQSPRGEVQIVTDGEENRVKEVRHKTHWSIKSRLEDIDKSVFKTGEADMDVSCTSNKNDEAVPVICVKWAVDIDIKNEAQALVESIIDLNYSSFSKSTVEDRIRDIAEESYIECENSDTEINASDCMLIYSAENIDLPNVNIVDVSKV